MPRYLEKLRNVTTCQAPQLNLSAIIYPITGLVKFGHFQLKNPVENVTEHFRVNDPPRVAIEPSQLWSIASETGGQKDRRRTSLMDSRIFRELGQKESINKLIIIITIIKGWLWRAQNGAPTNAFDLDAKKGNKIGLKKRGWRPPLPLSPLSSL
jgi:hypothetical protein